MSLNGKNSLEAADERDVDHYARDRGTEIEAGPPMGDCRGPGTPCRA